MPPETLTGEPTYDRARSLVAGGRSETAEKILEERNRESEQASPQADRTALLLGILALRDERPAKALEHFSQISQSYRRLPDYRLWYRAAAYEALGEIEAARDQYLNLVTDHPRSIWLNDALYKTADLDARLLGAPVAAPLVVDLLGGDWFSSAAFRRNTGAALSRFAEILENGGAREKALPLLERLYAEYPDAPEAAGVRDRIDALRADLNLAAFDLDAASSLGRARRLYRISDLNAATTEVNHALKRAREEGARGVFMEALALRGKLYEATDTLERSRNFYGWAIGKNYDEDGSFRFDLARLWARTSNRSAIKHYLLLVKHHPASKLAPKALYQAARLAQLSDEMRLANTLFDRLYDEYPKSEWVPFARFNQGWIAYREGDYEQASRAFEQVIAKHQDSDEYLRALYWGGRAAEALGRTHEAQLHYNLLLSDKPVSYYGTLAALRTSGSGAAFRAAPAAEKISEETLSMHRPRRLESEAALWELVARFDGARKNSVENAAELIALGLMPEAEREVELAATANQNDRRKIDLLITLFEHANAWRSAQRWAYQVNGERPGQITAETREFWQTLYPLGFAPYVQEYARRYGLDPHLVLAIMREESHFDPNITSWADARGLMQIIPPTGEQIARAQKLNGFDPQALYDPEINIRFGCYYLANLLERFSGNPFFAIASYNGGPHNVEKWRKKNGDLEIDVFIEEIPFHETRNYVKKVYRSWNLYRSLYGEGTQQARPAGNESESFTEQAALGAFSETDR